MQRVSYRTLAVLLMLLGLIVVQQHTAYALSAQAETAQLADDPNDPGCEAIWEVPSPSWLDDDPNDAQPGPERV